MPQRAGHSNCPLLETMVFKVCWSALHIARLTNETSKNMVSNIGALHIRLSSSVPHSRACNCPSEAFTQLSQLNHNLGTLKNDRGWLGNSRLLNLGLQGGKLGCRQRRSRSH